MAEAKGTSPSQSRPQRGEQLERQRSSGSGTIQRRANSPFELMRRMSHEMDRAFERIFEDVGVGRQFGLLRSPFSEAQGAAAWSPRVEAFQKDDNFIVRAELPGLKKEDVDVNVTEDAITIQGERQEEHERNEEGFYHTERSYGSFYRTIPLPEGVITDSAKASFKDGVLEIRLQAPPKEVSSGRRIQIEE
jgi:HSP20 family protein